MAAYRRLSFVLFFIGFPMRFQLPFTDGVQVRLFESVETVVPTYHIRDVGLEYRDGSIDSVAMGVSLVDRSSRKDDDGTNSPNSTNSRKS
jgi:hypothetical protein